MAPHARALCDFIAGPAPVLVEIGFDHGRRLLSTAAASPDWRVVGLEIRRHRCEEAVAWAERAELTNLHVWRFDARIVLASVLPDASVDVLEALFPDPWHNAAHRRKRQLVSAELLADAARVLRPGGLLHLVTDVERYAEAIDALVSEAQGFVCLDDAAGRARRPTCHQLSRREWKCGREGVPIHRWWLARDPGYNDIMDECNGHSGGGGGGP